MYNYLLICLVSLPFLFGPKDSDIAKVPERVVPDKIGGISWVGTRKVLDAESFTSLNRISADWVCLIPYAYGRQGETHLNTNLEWQWWGETTEGIRKSSQIAKRKGLKVMIKPQVWLMGDTYVGHFNLKTTDQWKEWEKNFEKYILDYARVAEQEGAEMFCVGTEFTLFFKKRPFFWKDLIGKVREVYSGKLTYAGNWDSFKDFPHWDLLDYIGVDAYFPLSDAKTPDVERLKNDWERHYQSMFKVHERVNKPVIFTEYGYRSIDFAAKEPWDYGKSSQVNLDAQHNAFEAVFQKFWEEDWFAGGFLWNWHPTDEKAGGKTCTDYTPQNKPVEKVIGNWYGKY